MALSDLEAHSGLNKKSNVIIEFCNPKNLHFDSRLIFKARSWSHPFEGWKEFSFKSRAGWKCWWDTKNRLPKSPPVPRKSFKLMENPLPQEKDIEKKFSNQGSNTATHTDTNDLSFRSKRLERKTRSEMEAVNYAKWRIDSRRFETATLKGQRAILLKFVNIN